MYTIDGCFNSSSSNNDYKKVDTTKLDYNSIFACVDDSIIQLDVNTTSKLHNKGSILQIHSIKIKYG